MSFAQSRAVAILGAVSALDGYDVLSITFAAPGISSEWGLTKGVLGVIFSMGLLGMGLGSFLLAPLADRIGRRPMVFICLTLMSTGMLASAFCTTPEALGACRVVTGIGIGAMVATIAPLAAEFANARRRPLAVAVMALGYPVGGVLGGLVAALLLHMFGWEAVFLFGFGLAVLLFPAIYFWVPESISFLLTKQTPQSIARFKTICLQFRLPVLATDRPPPEPTADLNLRVNIFRGPALLGTLHLGAVNFLNVITAYYMLSWMPQLVADAGYSEAAGTLVSSASSVSGVLGGIVLGWLGSRYAIKPFVVAVIIGMGLATMLFGLVPDQLGLLVGAAALAGFCLYASAVGVFNIITEFFPAESRVTGAGFVMGVGRGGSALAPLLAGYLFQSGFDRGDVSIVMASCAILGGVLLAFLRVRPGEPVPATQRSSAHA